MTEKVNREKKHLSKSRQEIFNTHRKKLEEIIVNLSEDIKEYQRKLKLLGPQNKTIEVISKRILAKLSENNYEIIQIILNKKKKNK